MPTIDTGRRFTTGAWLSILAVVFCSVSAAQQSSSNQAAQSRESQDTLGRTTPRGTVLRFLSSARKGDFETAALYLSTRKRGESAATLARQLFVVLDRRLPAKLNKLSDDPEGSLTYPADPDIDLVGTVASSSGSVDILIQRIDRGKLGSVWLFAGKTLATIPELYEEVNSQAVEGVIPKFLLVTKVAEITLFQWFTFLIVLPFLYYCLGLLNRFLSRLPSYIQRKRSKKLALSELEILPGSLRLLLLALLIRSAQSTIGLSLMARQFWSIVATIIMVVGLIWTILQLNGFIERQVRQRIGRIDLTGRLSFVRFIRRAVDMLVLFAGGLALLRYFGVNASAAVAGLGVGGIAVALAAQKTLENVIGGASVITDQPVRVGDWLRVGETTGEVIEIGLRSLRIVTPDRTIVSIPNGQIANATLENFSLRDKFWFHHVLSLRYGTSVAQLRSLLPQLGELLTSRPEVDTNSVRIRFLRFGVSSLDVELFAYVFARDFPLFLEVQQELLLRVLEVVQAAGTDIAVPSTTVYLAGTGTVQKASVDRVVAALRAS